MKSGSMLRITAAKAWSYRSPFQNH